MSTLSDEDLTRLLDETASAYDVPENGPTEVLAALRDLPQPTPLLRRRWVQLSAAASVVIAGTVFAVAQVGGGAGSRSEVAGSATSSSQGDSRLRGPVLSPQKAVGGGSAGSAGSVAAVPAPATAPQAPSLAHGGAPATSLGADGADGRIVKSGTLALVVKDGRVTPTLTAVEDAAHAEGGYVSDGKTDEYGDSPSGEVTLRVPVDRFEALVKRVRSLDVKVRTASTSGKDVTAEYSDVEAQLRSLKATRDRFYVILGKATTIGDILSVQQRIDNVSTSIDRLEGQRKLLGAQSSLSTLTVSVTQESDPVVRTEKPRSGLSQAFSDAWDGFVTGVEGLIRHSGRALLVLMCVAVLLLVARGGWRVARRRMV